MPSSTIETSPPLAARAVFLSYASQDATAAAKICDALRATGVEVWFDQNELVGGDAWDAKIRKQIKECALFVPIISANTQARTEGYFRLEWRIADQRTHLMAKGRPFLLPVVIDDTRDADAHVPDSFLEVQWTRLAGGETPEKFCARVKRLLAGEVAPASSPASQSKAGETPALPRKAGSAIWLRFTLGALAILIAGVGAYFALRPHRSPEEIAKLVANAQTLAANVATKSSAASAEFEQLRQQVVPDRWQKEDFEAMVPRLDRIVQNDPDRADASALRSIIYSLQVLRNFDSGTKPLEAGKADAERALRLAPQSSLAELAMGMHLVAMISRGGDPQACRPWIDGAVAKLPRDHLARYAEGVSHWLSYEFDDSERSMQAWLAAEPQAAFPSWILAQLRNADRKPAEAEQFAKQGLNDPGITGVRCLYVIFESNYYLRADLARSREALERIPPNGNSVHRVVHARWLVAMAEHRWDDALQELSRLPENFLFDRPYHGPKALLAGLAHARAGRTDAASAQFREAERVLREHLATDTDNEELHAVLAVTLACLNRADEARRELALIEPLVEHRAPNVYRGSLVLLIAEARCVLGDFAAVAHWARKLFAERSAFPFTPASFRLDPRFNAAIDAPEVQALLKEFVSLDQPAANTATDDKSVAVLAFADLSAAHDSEYFSDGISEELLNALGKVPGLKVPARTSSFYFKGKSVPVPEIAKQLGVAYVVEGSVQRVGERVKISARLTKAADGFQVWADSFPRDAKDVFAVEEEIAGLIAKQLALKLGATAAAVTAVVNPQAFELYAQARQAWNLRTLEGFTRAEELLRHVLELDPNFGRAYSALADIRLIRDSEAQKIGSFTQRNTPQMAAIAADIARALALDSNSAEAHAAAGIAAIIDWRLTEADRELRRAIELNPNYAPAHQRLGLLLAADARLESALAELKRATELDPFAARILDNYALALFHAGRVDEALAMAERALQVQPGAPQALAWKSWALLSLHRSDEAVAIARQLQAQGVRSVLWMPVFCRVGLKVEVQAALGALDAKDQARVYALTLLGRRDEALTALRESGFTWFVFESMLYDEAIDPIRDDPRFAKLLEELGVSEAHARAQAWRAAHPPEKNTAK